MVSAREQCCSPTVATTAMPSARNSTSKGRVPTSARSSTGSSGRGSVRRPTGSAIWYRLDWRGPLGGFSSPARQARPARRAPLGAPHQILRNRHDLHFIRPGIDLQDLRIAHQLFDTRRAHVTGAAEYLRITTTVTWPKMNGIDPVVLESFVTPRRGNAVDGSRRRSEPTQNCLGLMGSTHHRP